MSLTMDPVPPFSHLSVEAQQRNLRHPQQPPLHHPRPPLASNTGQAHPSAAPVSVQSRGLDRADTSLARSTTSSNQSTRDHLPLSPARPLQTTWSTSPHSAARPHTYLHHPNTNSPSHPAPSTWLLPTPPQQHHHHQQHSSAVPSHPPPPQSSAVPPSPHTPTTTTTTMGSVHYAVPAQYGPLGIDESSLHTQGYPFDHGFRAAHPHQQAPPPASYDFSQPEAYGATVLRTSSPMPLPHQYADDYRNTTSYSHAPGMAPRTMPSTSMSSTTSTYSSPSMYEQSMYSHQPLAQSMAGQVPQSLAYAQPMYTTSSISSLPRSMSSISSASSARASNQKPKPQCWDHGCNGRRFSTFSNLLRHQREKSGMATKSYCPKCGAEFTRTTARNGHLAHDKCSKQRKDSTGSH